MTRDLVDSSLDDRIDRVARQLTDVSPASAVSTQVRNQLQAPAGVRWTPVLVACATAAAALTTLVLWRGPADGDSASRRPPVLAGAAVEDIAPYPAPALRASVSPPAGERAETRRQVQQVAQVPVLMNVEPLTIAPIEFESLSELEVLHVDGIRIADIANEVMKEPR